MGHTILLFAVVIVQVHEALDLIPDDRQEAHFGIWSVKWSKTGNQLIAGGTRKYS